MRGPTTNMRAVAWTAACLLLVLALRPHRACAEDDDVRLPFLLTDGTVRPYDPLVPVLLPAWQGGVGDDYGDGQPASDPGPGFPLRLRLLQEFPGASYGMHAGRVRLPDEGPARARLERLLAAIEVGFTRRARVEVEATLDGLAPARLSGVAPVGSVLVSDERVEHAHPAGLGIETVALHAEMMGAKIGPRIVASATDVGSFFVLRLAVHLSHAGEDVRFESRRLTLVAPRVTVAALVVEVPAAPGETGTLQIGELRVTWRVTPIDGPKPPAGTRAVHVDARAPLFVPVVPPEPGVLSLEGFEAFEPEIASAPDPLPLPEAGDGVARHDVPPGLVLLEGDEAHLPHASRRWNEAWRRLRAPVRLTFTTRSGLKVDVPVARPAPIVFVSGHLDPVVAHLTAEISMGRIQAAPTLGMVFSGRTLAIDVEDPRPNIRECHAPRPDPRPRLVPIVVQTNGVDVPEVLPLTDMTLKSAKTSRRLRAEEIRVWSNAR